MPVDPAVTAAVGALRTSRRPSRPPKLNIIAVIIFLVFLVVGLGWSGIATSGVPLVAMIVLGIIAAQSPRIAAEWERGVVLRLGRFQGLRGPGLFWVIPFFDSVNSWIDQRVITTGFAAEQSLTADTVPVNVDAVLFWLVH